MKSLINLHHLKFYCDAVLYGSVSEAAKMNYVTQSTVSQAISKLEVVLGTQLAVHKRQKFEITEEGKIVFEQARNIFKTVQDIHEKLNQAKEGISGLVKFVSTNSLGTAFASTMFKKMQHRYPDVQLHFRLGGLNFIRNALRQKEAEFAIVVYDQDFSQFNKHSLKKGCFNLYQHVEAPYPVLENGILVDYSEGINVSYLRECFFQNTGSQLKLQMELSGWLMVAQFTQQNIGIGFFPDYLATSNVKVFPMEIPRFEYEICAIYNKGEKLSRAAQAFIDEFTLE